MWLTLHASCCWTYMPQAAHCTCLLLFTAHPLNCGSLCMSSEIWLSTHAPWADCTPCEPGAALAESFVLDCFFFFFFLRRSNWRRKKKISDMERGEEDGVEPFAAMVCTDFQNKWGLMFKGWRVSFNFFFISSRIRYMVNTVHNAQGWRVSILTWLVLCVADFTTLFKYLSTVQGSLDTRRSFVRDITQEAMRFKRKTLVSLLKQFEDSLVRGDNRNRGKSSISWLLDKESVESVDLCLFKYRIEVGWFVFQWFACGCVCG